MSSGAFSSCWCHPFASFKVFQCVNEILGALGRCQTPRESGGETENPSAFQELMRQKKGTKDSDKLAACINCQWLVLPCVFSDRIICSPALQVSFTLFGVGRCYCYYIVLYNSFQTNILILISRKILWEPLVPYRFWMSQSLESCNVCSRRFVQMPILTLEYPTRVKSLTGPVQDTNCGGWNCWLCYGRNRMHWAWSGWSRHWFWHSDTLNSPLEDIGSF